MTTKNWILLIGFVAIILATMYFSCQHGINSVLKKTVHDTTINTDTSIIRYKPVPFKIIHDSLIYVKGNSVTVEVIDTVEIGNDFGFGTDPPDVDTAAILAQYNQRVLYSDTLQPPRIKRGKIIINDTLHKNRIAGRGVEVINQDTTFTNTTVLKQPKKAIVYFGMDYLGYQKTPFFAIGVDLALKMPDDKMFSAGVLIDKDGRLIYQAGAKIPIRLRFK